MEVKKLDLKTPGIIYGLFSVIVLLAWFILFTDGKFPVQHYNAIPGNSNYPEHWIVGISPAYAFSLTWTFWRVLGIIVWLAVGVWLVAMANDLIKSEAVYKYRIWITGLGLLLALFLMFGSTGYTNNSVAVDPVKYDRIKDSKDSLKTLFSRENLIK